MTTLAAETGLLRAILEAPEDDALRLVYSDWLEENGDRERAEFVRVQVERAACGCRCDPSCGYACLWCDEHNERGETLRRRERELLNKYAGDWLPTDWDAWQPEGERIAVSNRGGPSYHCLFRRGFPSRISCTLADWLAHGPAIVACCPVEGLTLVDIEPEKTRVAYPDKWTPVSFATMPRKRPPFDIGGWFDTAEEASAALHLRALNWARAQVKPPLPLLPPRG